MRSKPFSVCRTMCHPADPAATRSKSSFQGTTARMEPFTTYAGNPCGGASAGFAGTTRPFSSKTGSASASPVSTRCRSSKPPARKTRPRVTARPATGLGIASARREAASSRRCAASRDHARRSGRSRCACHSRKRDRRRAPRPTCPCRGGRTAGTSRRRGVAARRDSRCRRTRRRVRARRPHRRAWGLPLLRA